MGGLLETSSLSTAVDESLHEIIGSLPPARFAFAYGSGVFPQVHHTSSSPMLDVILAVDCPHAWHTANLRMNPSHYSIPLRFLGAGATTVLQRSFGAGVYFNTLLSPPAFKYGVIALADLHRDLSSWDTLYIAGRMHKPIRVLSSTALPSVTQTALSSNLSAATSAALLTLPQHFQEADLYHAAAALSYAGDIRMALRAEVSDKVRNIVRANMMHFRGLYDSTVSDAGVLRRGGTGGVWERSLGSEEQARLLDRLPRRVLLGVGRALGVHAEGGEGGAAWKHEMTGEVARKDISEVRVAVLGVVAGIVAKSSLRQSLKGVLTAGVGTSVRYVTQKVRKAVAARRRRQILV